MPVSGRVRDDDKIAEFHGKYLIAQAGKRFRVYEDGSYYSQTSGGVSKKGNVMRDAEGKPVSFEAVGQAMSWIDKGCLIFPEITF